MTEDFLAFWKPHLNTSPHTGTESCRERCVATALLHVSDRHLLGLDARKDCPILQGGKATVDQLRVRPCMIVAVGFRQVVALSAALGEIHISDRSVRTCRRCRNLSGTRLQMRW